ncbi:phage holin family protein [Prevotella sp.]|uniref:phage holin family protein n=1 Tax=Prevotella sp. TaxID=59823 RepID=UPI002F93C5F1
MFSSDQNIETIGQLVEVVRHYIGLQSEYVKLDVVEKIVRLLTAVLMMGILSLLLILVFIYLSFAAAHALAPITGLACAFLIIAGCYFAVFLLFIIFRRKWIEKPLVQFLASILMQK